MRLLHFEYKADKQTISLQKLEWSFNISIQLTKIVISTYKCSSRWYLIWSQDPLVIHVVRMDITRMKPDSIRTAFCREYNIH